MKVFITCLLVFGLTVQELASAAPRWIPLTKPSHKVPAPTFPLHPRPQSGPRILGGGGEGEPQEDKTAINQVLPALLAPAALSLAPAALNLAPELAKPLLNFGASVGRSVLCNRNSAADDSWVQEYSVGNEEERDAKLMALVKIMGDVVMAQGKLSEAKKLNVENNVVAKAELFDAISDALDGALGFVGDTAKTLLCLQ